MKKRTLRIIISLITLINLVLSMTFSSIANIPPGGATPPWNSDNDNDGLTYHQEHLELNPYKDDPLVECDEYGVPNGIYDSNINDTDGNGVLDSQEDLDEDGIINIDELTIFSGIYDPILADTDNNSVLDGDEDYDNDGLTNAEELYIYHTNPLLADTDEDGLSDFIEINNFNGAYDPNIADTDENGIIDGQEDYDVDGINNANELNCFATIYNSEMADTDNNSVLDGDEDYDNDGIINKDEINVFNGIYDPTIADSDENSTLDGVEDYDQDELTNIEELYTYSTNPLFADTDGDGFTDGEEIAGVGENNQYLTDPLKYDTDDDYISDFDEIELGLNPLLDKTDGFNFDYNRTFEAEIDTDSPIIQEINNESPYDISINADIAGNLNNLNVDFSGNNAIGMSGAVVGNVIDFNYDENLAVNAFEVSYTFTGNTAKYNVFKYFEDLNMFLPIETEKVGNTIKTNVTEFGSYCVMNLEQLKINAYEPNQTEVKTTVIDGREHKYLKIGFSDILEGGITWEQARIYCESVGGHLATITTTDEQDFILDNVIIDPNSLNNNAGGYWLGAECTGTSWLKDTITWITGEEVDYSQTLYGNGNNLWISANGEWYNSVSGGIGFICEWEEEFDVDGLYEYFSLYDWSTHYLDGELRADNDIDTDGDGLTDWEEINTANDLTVLTSDGNGIEQAPTVGEIINDAKLAHSFVDNVFEPQVSTVPMAFVGGLLAGASARPQSLVFRQGVGDALAPAMFSFSSQIQLLTYTTTVPPSTKDKNALSEISSPNDQDADNDGIVDKYEDIVVHRNIPNDGSHMSEAGKDYKFYVYKTYNQQKKTYFNVIPIYNNIINLYSEPFDGNQDLNNISKNDTFLNNVYSGNYVSTFQNFEIYSIIVKFGKYNLDSDEYRTRGVLKPEVWFKIKNNNKFGYIKYNSTSFNLGAISSDVAKVIDLYTVYPFSNDYNGQGTSTATTAENIFKLNPEYQIFARELYQQNKTFLNSYAPEQFNEFSFIAISFGEACAGEGDINGKKVLVHSLTKNIFGVKDGQNDNVIKNIDYKYLEYDMLVNTLVKTGLASSTKHAKSIINKDKIMKTYNDNFFTQIGYCLYCMHNGYKYGIEININYQNYNTSELPNIQRWATNKANNLTDRYYYGYDKTL